MEDKVELTDAFGEKAFIIQFLMKQTEVFKDRMDRLRSSEVSTLIMVNDEVAGFVNLVRENRNYDFLFLDMFILEEYRSRKIGSKVFEILQNEGIKDMIIAETKQSNISANKTANNCCVKLGCFEDRNIYLVQKDRLEEFIDNNYMEKLAKHYEKDSVKKLIREF